MHAVVLVLVLCFVHIPAQIIILEYRPTRPFYRPNPGNTLAQIIPPGKPWPDSIEGYNNFSQLAPVLVDRLKEPGTNVSSSFSITQENKSDNTMQQIVPPDKPDQVISLEYKPMRPFHAPNPATTLAPIVPPGQPWPSSLENYQNLSQNLQDRLKDTSSSTTPLGFTKPSDKVDQFVSTGKPGLDSPAGYPNFKPNVSLLEDRLNINISATTPSGFLWTPEQITQVQNSEHKPMRPTFHPSQAQEAWVDTNSSQPLNLQDRINQNSSNQAVTDISSTKLPDQVINIEYKPTRPFFAGSPATLAPIVPPGKPWPAKPEDYATFSPTPLALNDRFKETTTTKRPSGFVWGLTDSLGKPTVSTSEQQKPIAQTDLEYKPMRPSFHPNPGDKLGQIIPPGKPWPDSPEGYGTSVFLGDRIKETTSIKAPTGFLWGDDSNWGNKRPENVAQEASLRPGATLGEIIASGDPWPIKSQASSWYLCNQERKDMGPPSVDKTDVAQGQAPVVQEEHKPSESSTINPETNVLPLNRAETTTTRVLILEGESKKVPTDSVNNPGISLDLGPLHTSAIPAEGFTTPPNKLYTSAIGSTSERPPVIPNVLSSSDPGKKRNRQVVM